jgi:Mor family transcriptional regulator
MIFEALDTPEKKIYKFSYWSNSMNKVSEKIDTMTIIVESKEGTSDSSIMKQCNLPETRVESLFSKVAESGTIRHLNDKDIIKNLKGGAWDSNLAKGCESAQVPVDQVFPQIEDMTFSNKIEYATAEIGKGTISGKEIVRDINSGMSGLQLMAKYGFSAQQLRKAVKIILKERKKIAMAIADDVRCGLTAPELMKKYQLSDAGLRRAYNKLLTDGLLQPADIKEFQGSFEGPAPFPNERRETPRRTPSVPIAVYDSSNNGPKGTIKDISEKGLAVRGIAGIVGESKILSILGDDFGLVDPFEVEVECRWAGNEAPAAHRVAGFKITAISDSDLRRLQRLMEFVDQIDKVTS